MAESQLISFSHSQISRVSSADNDRAAFRRNKSADRLDKLSLPVSVNARKTHNLSGMNRKAEILHAQNFLRIHHAEVLHLKDRTACFGRALLDLEIHRTTDHFRGHKRGIRRSHIHNVNQLSAADNRAAVGHCLYLVQLVRDYHDGFSFLHKIPDNPHEFVDFLRSQNRRRLVKNQDVGVAVEHFQNLHTLLHSHGNVLNLHVGIDVQSVLFAKRLDSCGSLLSVQDESAFLSQDYVLGNRKVSHKLKVLVDHSDSKPRRVIRILYRNFLSADFYRSPVGMIKPEQDAHQRGFSRPVLAQNRMNLAVPHLKRNIIVRDNTRKFLPDIEHLNHIIVCAHFYSNLNFQHEIISQQTDSV